MGLYYFILGHYYLYIPESIQIWEKNPYFLNIFNFGQFWPAKIDKKSRPASRLKLATLQEKALVRAFSVIVKYLGTFVKPLNFVWSSNRQPETRLCQGNAANVILLCQSLLILRYTFLFWIVGSCFNQFFLLWEIWMLLFTNKIFWEMG